MIKIFQLHQSLLAGLGPSVPSPLRGYREPNTQPNHNTQLYKPYGTQNALKTPDKTMQICGHWGTLAQDFYETL